MEYPKLFLEEFYLNILKVSVLINSQTAGQRD